MNAATGPAWGGTSLALRSGTLGITISNSMSEEKRMVYEIDWIDPNKSNHDWTR
jgi:hypothetical protein